MQHQACKLLNSLNNNYKFSEKVPVEWQKKNPKMLLLGVHCPLHMHNLIQIIS